jgi:serine/threonine protein kinase
MALSKARKVVDGETPYPHEREALDYAFSVLPDSDPFQVWALTELLEPATGRLYELDLIVLGYSALYLVEIKSGPGCYVGDHHEWWRTPPGSSRAVYMDGPLSLCNLKAKVLKSRLQAKMKHPGRCPYIQPLIFLSAVDLDVKLTAEGRTGVVTRKDLAAALQRHQFPGANPGWRAERIDPSVMHDVGQGLASLGMRTRKGRAFVGSYELGELIADGIGYQDRVAKHKARDFETRARVYVVPPEVSVERRQQLRRAAERESNLLWDVRDHANILRIADEIPDAPVGPAIVFDAFGDGIPLDAFLRRTPDLPFEDRLSIVEQVGRGIAHCHRKSIIHGAIAPQSVLVRRQPETGAIEVRLFNFQLGAGREVEVTQHWSALAQEGWAIYQAPELRENPLARSPQSDLFSLGALAYFTMTGRAPGERVEDIDRRLTQEGHLDPRAVTDATPGRVLDSKRVDLADVIAYATKAAPVNRPDRVDEWLELLLDVATAPDEKPAAAEVDPLMATKGDVVGADLEVAGVLGTGSTARVLLVRRTTDDRMLALKVCADSAHDARLVDEATVLKGLPKHPRIVDLYADLTIKGRRCLLLSLAGERTLQEKIAQLGPVSLEEAGRYGDDLLLALEHLEENQVLHRDIKPANLGVGSVSKLADHLTLFDFSLSRLPPSEVRVGTAVYRDPYLRDEGRGVWDFAADRWSAAVTLHEMLAATRPTFTGGSAIDKDARVVLAAERFDASVRDELVEFFGRAFARSATGRFTSAHAMRHAWVSILGAPARAPKTKAKGPTADAPEPETAELTDADVAAIAPEATVAALPLTVRARNALDRAGLTRTQDLLALGSNRLSAIRGIGTLVAREILDFRDRWSRLRPPAGSGELVVFFPGYAGDDFQLGTVQVDAKTAAALIDAGLPTLRAVAQAPEAHIVSLAARQTFDVEVLRKVLADENGRANQRVRPTTLEGWIDALLPPRKGKNDRHLVRALYGLDAPFEGRLDVKVSELAAKEEKTTAAVYLAVGKAAADWGTHAALPALRDRVTDLIEAAGGASPLGALGDELARATPRGADLSASLLRAMGAALVRVVIEVDKDAPSALRLVRLRDREPWVFLTDEHGRVTRRLGDTADALASRPTLVSTGEVRRIMAEIVAGTPLGSLKEERLLEIAAAASERAACSTRLELYPRGLDPQRVLELCAATFKGGVSEEDIRGRVTVRYPEAAALPSRPALDALLAPLGFQWEGTAARYVRPGETQVTTLQTRVSSLGRVQTALPTQARAMDADAIDARQFDEKLKHALEMNAFRAIGVTAERALDAALALEARLGANMVALDVELAKEVALQMKAAKIASDDVVHTADREGPRGPAWGKLLKLVHGAADALATRLAKTDRPLLLIQPGPIARYGLTELLRRLVEVGANRETPAVFLLIPMHDTGGMPRVDGTMSIPGLLPGQAMWVSRAWLSNRHNAAA